MKLGVSQSYLSMEWPLVKFLLWALLLFVQIHEHRACIEVERKGLLELKAFLKSRTNHTKPLLPTWVNDTKSAVVGSRSSVAPPLVMWSSSCSPEQTNSNQQKIYILSTIITSCGDVWSIWKFSVHYFCSFGIACQWCHTFDEISTKLDVSSFHSIPLPRPSHLVINLNDWLILYSSLINMAHDYWEPNSSGYQRGFHLTTW